MGRRASTPRADSLLVGIFALLFCFFLAWFSFVVSSSVIISRCCWCVVVIHFVRFGYGWTSARCVAAERKCSGRCGRRCWVTQKGLTVGFIVVATDLFEERRPVEGEAELDVTQGVTPTASPSSSKNAVGVLLVGSG